MSELRFSSRYDEWSEEPDLCFRSPPWRGDQEEQLLLFAGQTKDGSIEGEITFLASKPSPGEEAKEACFLIRYAPPEMGYCVGTGAFGTKLFIARMNPGNWQVLASSGKRTSLAYDRTYHLKAEFVGSQITLYENGVKLLSAVDEKYSSGQFGLRTRKVRAQFAAVKLGISKPLCFVVMPFSSELNYVYKTIKETVESLGLECVRGDERSISRPVIDDIRADIARADLVIVDFTSRNSNVYYEAGLADAWRKKWIVIAQSPDDLTFDVKHIRTIFYSDRMGADVQFRQDLEKSIRDTMSFSQIK